MMEETLDIILVLKTSFVWCVHTVVLLPNAFKYKIHPHTLPKTKKCETFVEKH
jgi:hypothetical protein